VPLAGDMPVPGDMPATGLDDMAGVPAPRWFASHELRTPLQAIQGGVELLLEDGGRGLSSLQLEAVSLIAEAAASLERCVTQMAELAEVGLAPPAPLEPMALADFLARPEIARHVSPGHCLDAAAEVVVQVAPDPAGRALAKLAHLFAGLRGDTASGRAHEGSATHRLALELDLLGESEVSFAAALPSPSSGDGAVTCRLARALLERAGFALAPGKEGRARLTLRRAARKTI